MKLTDICNHVGIHKSKGYSILNTLKNYGLVEKDHQTKTYSLGPALIFLSGRVLDNMDYRNTVAPFLEYLAKETNSAAFFGLIVDEHVFVIAKHEVDSGIKITIRLGYRFPITYGAHGKAIVAFLPKVEREKILAGGKLWFYGDISRLNVERLEDEFARCRQLGFAQDRGEMDPRFNAVAAPVFGLHGKLIHLYLSLESLMIVWSINMVIKLLSVPEKFPITSERMLTTFMRRQLKEGCK